MASQKTNEQIHAHEFNYAYHVPHQPEVTWLSERWDRLTEESVMAQLRGNILKGWNFVL